MSKKFIAGLALGLGIPAIASGIVFGVPSIRERVLHRPDNSEYVQQIEELEKSNTSLTKENEDLKSENTSLKQNNLTYVGRIESLSSELATAKSSIKLKDDEITSKENQIKTLTQEKELIQKDLERYKELAGSDVNYIELVNSLQIQLEEKTNSLTSANAELEQLKVDKTSLETRVEELSTELTQVKEELTNYKSLENIEKLNVNSFNGIWYLNGTFADYYTIENGVVTHNANEDKGLLNNIYNQMYLMMNTSGGHGVTLSDDGTQFETDDGKVYSKFYINTVNTVTPIYTFCGKYCNENVIVKLNSDNTTTLVDGNNTYIGAYIVNSVEKNIGGNVTIFNTITATYQTDSEPIVKVFENASRNNILICNDIIFNLLESSNASILTSSSNFTIPTTGYYKVKVKLDKPMKYYSNTNCSLYFRFAGSSNYSIGQCNGDNLFTSRSLSFSLNDFGNDTDMFEFYFVPNQYFSQVKFLGFDYIYYNSIRYNIDKVLSVENVGLDYSQYPLYGDLKNVYEASHREFYNVSCQAFMNYIIGTYSNDTYTLNISEDNATVNEITATLYNIVASTDGTDIYQTVTINYVTTVDEVDTTHVLILKLKNEILISSLLDNEEIALIKSN